MSTTFYASRPSLASLSALCPSCEASPKPVHSVKGLASLVFHPLLHILSCSLDSTHLWDLLGEYPAHHLPHHSPGLQKGPRETAARGPSPEGILPNPILCRGPSLEGGNCSVWQQWWGLQRKSGLQLVGPRFGSHCSMERALDQSRMSSLLLNPMSIFWVLKLCLCLLYFISSSAKLFFPFPLMPHSLGFYYSSIHFLLFKQIFLIVKYLMNFLNILIF